MTQASIHGPRWTSSSASSRGPNHPVNQDSFAANEGDGLFVVADGVGGSSQGEIASAAVVGIVYDAVTPDQAFEDRVGRVEDALASVNAALWRSGQERPQACTIATTVAALLLGRDHAVCLWAGDSRIYLYRQSRLYQLTRDHNLAEEFGTEGSVGGQLTRAVGSLEEIEVQRVVITTLPGDRFLICSDGVTKVIDHEELAFLLDGAVEGSASRIIGAVVDRGGTDDATAVVVGEAVQPGREPVWPDDRLAVAS